MTVQPPPEEVAHVLTDVASELAQGIGGVLHGTAIRSVLVLFAFDSAISVTTADPREAAHWLRQQAEQLDKHADTINRVRATAGQVPT